MCDVCGNKVSHNAMIELKHIDNADVLTLIDNNMPHGWKRSKRTKEWSTRTDEDYHSCPSCTTVFDAIKITD